MADREEWETRKLRRLGDRQNTPPSQLRFIVDALAQIAECRRVLKWTYGFGYYHFEGGESAKKRFFEFAQADAEENLERLTEAVETELETFLTETRDAAEFGAFRGKLAGLTDITHKYFDTLVVEIKFDRADRKLANRYAQGIPIRVSRNSKYVIGVDSITYD